VWFLIELVEQLDLSVFEEWYRLGAQGRAPWSPRVLLTLLFYAYTRGVESSRAIERACREDVVFRVICGNEAPDHTTIARFRQRHEAAFTDLFVQVLRLCGRAGLVRLGVVAVDGTKMAANASTGANREVERLRQEVARIVERAEDLDAEEDERFGDRRGDELPDELVDAAARKARIEELLAEAEQQGDARFNMTDPDSRLMSSPKGFVQGYNAQVVAGPGNMILAVDVSNDKNDYAQLVPMLDALGEILAGAGIDGDVGTVLADAGYFTIANLEHCEDQGVDALIATGKHDQSNDAWLDDPWEAYDADQAACDAERDAERQRQAAIFERVAQAGTPISHVLDELGLKAPAASAHYAQWREGGTSAISTPRRRGMPKPLTPRIRYRHEAKMATAENRALYKQRAHLAETIFAERKYNRGFSRFRRRGLAAVRAEWQFQGAAHNAIRLRQALTALFGVRYATT